MRSDISRIEAENIQLQGQIRIKETDLNRLNQDLSMLRENQSAMELQNNLNIQIRALESELMRLRASLTDEQNRTAIQTSNYERARQTVDSLEHDITLLKDQHEQQRRIWETGKDALMSQIAVLTDSESRLRQQAVVSDQSIVQLTRSLRDAQAQLNRALDDKERRGGLEVELSKQLTVIESLRSQLADTSRYTAELEMRIECIKSEYNALLLSSRSEVEVLRKNLSHMENQRNRSDRLLAWRTSSTSIVSAISSEFSLTREVDRLDSSITSLESEVKELSKGRHMLSTSTSLDMSSPVQDISKLQSDIAKLKHELEDTKQKLASSEEQYEKRVSELQHSQKTIELLNERCASSTRAYDENVQAMRDDIQELQSIDKEVNNTSLLSTPYVDDGVDMRAQSQLIERELRRLRALVRFYRHDQRVMSQSRAEADLRIQALEVENTAIRKEIATLKSQLEHSNTRADFLEQEVQSMSDPDHTKVRSTAGTKPESNNKSKGGDMNESESMFSGNVLVPFEVL